MLQNIRDKLTLHKWISYTFFGALILVFAAWGAYGIVDFTVGTTGFAAKVNGEKIPLEQVNEAWQQQQPQLLRAFGGELTEAQRSEFQGRLLDGYVRNLVATQTARKLGYRVSNAQVMQAFQSEQAFQVDGKFNMEAAKSRLLTAGVTEAAFVDDLRRSLLSNQLAGAIAATDFLTQTEAQRLIALQDEQREVRYALLQPEAFGAGPPIEAGAIEAYYNANAALYTPPEGVKLAFAELTLADVAATVQVSEEDLRARYERDKSVFVEPERRRARHILISVDGGTDDAKASAQAKDLRARVTADNFAALAKEFSKDSASAAEGGVLDWSGREAYVVPFADALFALQEGEISQPVKTQFGYHLIKLEGVRAGSARTFDDVRGELMATLRTEVAADEFGNRQEQLQERVESGAGDLAQLVQEFGLRRGEVEHFERGNGGLPLGSDVGLNEAVFSDAVLNQRRVGGPIQLGEDRLTVVQVIDHQLPKLKPLSEVRDAVTAALIRQRGETGAAKTAEVALARLSAGESFDKVLADLKIKAEPARFVGRGEPDLPVELRDAAFAMSKPVAGKPARRSLAVEGGAAALLEVTAVRAELTSTNAQLLSLRAQREQQRYSLRDVEAYLSELVKSAKVSKNSQAFQ